MCKRSLVTLFTDAFVLLFCLCDPFMIDRRAIGLLLQLRMANGKLMYNFLLTHNNNTFDPNVSLRLSIVLSSVVRAPPLHLQNCLTKLSFSNG